MALDREQRVWLEMLRITLLEIRALEDGDLDRARDLANIFHNVPGTLFGTPSAWAQQKDALFARARALGLEDFVRRDLAFIEKTMK